MYEFYTSHSSITVPDEYVSLFSELPSDISELCRIIQGLLLHIGWLKEYDVLPGPERRKEESLRKVSRQLKKIMDLDDHPLNVPRPVDKRLLGMCRDFAVLLCSMLRHHGIPARARCGFGTYFWKDHYCDHWICEYYDYATARWVVVDPQIDEMQRTTLSIGFDLLDMPQGQFVSGGDAWRKCRGVGSWGRAKLTCCKNKESE